MMNLNNLVNRCFLCDTISTKKSLEIVEPDRFEIAVGIEKSGYKRYWLECPNCGLAINGHIAENLTKIEKLSENYYEADFGNVDLTARYNKIRGLNKDQSDNFWRTQRIKNQLNQWELFCRKKGYDGAQIKKVLDIGAGLGVFLSEFIGDLWEGDAVEPDPNAVKHLRSIALGKKINVYEGLYDGQSNFINYDLITLNKVVEHIQNPIGLLNKVQKSLRSVTGLLYVEVPDKITIECRPSTDNILGSLHYNLYDIQTLSLLLNKAGFVTISSSTILEPSGKISTYAFALPKQSYSNLVK